MKILLSWLRELVDLPDDLEQITKALDDLGLAVEGVEQTGESVPGVVTAKVLRTEVHPDAAKVRRVYVDAGDGVERHVWCGASNMDAGDVVALATLGTKMPDGREILKRGILGIDSEGMLCSTKELGLGEDHTGIMILDGATPLGVPLNDALGVQPDVLIDLDLTRNRPDAWGYVGVARDLAAHFGTALHAPAPSLVATGAERVAPVTLVDGERCPRFTSLVLSGVQVTSSPRWMANRLEAAGMRSINNVVDVSNYVMLEQNQPNHAYDLDTLGGGGFRIRLAADGERLVTLDGVERTLTATDLLICDANDVPIGLGGVMGGEHTEISESTSVVALEIAYFEPVGISQTAPRLGLRSEASARYERGADPYAIEVSAARFVELLRETCPDLIVHAGWVDARHDSLRPERVTTRLRLSQIERILGTAIERDTVRSLLDPIGFTTSTTDDPDVLEVVLPSWRADATAEIDVIEEVARHYGYDRLGKTVPNSIVHGHLSPVQQRRRRLRELLLGLGLTEVMPNPFLGEDDLARAGLPTEALRLANPLVAEAPILRTALRPGMLSTVAYNESHRSTGVAIFEIGHVYPPSGEQLPAEYEALAVAIAGAEAPAAVSVWREIAAELGFGCRLDQGIVPPGMHPGRSASLTQGRTVVGIVGEIHPAVLAEFDVAERVAYLELDLDIVLGAKESIPQAKPVSRFPSADVDLAFDVPDDVAAEKVDKALRQGAGKLLADVSLFDVYRKPGVEGTRSLAYRVRFQAPDRTLGEQELANARQGCIAAVEKLGATLRG
ncbi:MAG: phenylalanine--tRNA ligase subunit beta [Ilumatobacteraceae bacterium]